jgi:hypothetical protein
MGPDGARYQERLSWRGPAAIYWAGLDWTGLEASLSRESREESRKNLQLDGPVRVWDCCETWWRRGRWRSPHCCKSLRSNAGLIVRQSPASKDVSTKAEEATSSEAVIRQPVKTQQTEKT